MSSVAAVLEVEPHRKRGESERDGAISDDVVASPSVTGRCACVMKIIRQQKYRWYCR